MVDSHEESQWYEALLEEDCVRIMDLLARHPSLVKIGWTSEPPREATKVVERSPSRVPWGWCGCTALHVGARRGCADLVKQVLDIYNVNYENESEDESLKAKGEGLRKLTPSGKKNEVIVESTAAGLAESEGAASGLNGKKSPISFPLQEDGEHDQKVGNWQEVPVLAQDVAMEKSVKSAESKAEKDARILELTVAHWKRQMMGADERARISLARWKSKLVNSLDSDSTENRAGGVSSDLAKLLQARDGFCKLDAFAIAVIDGSVDVIILLMAASRNCERNPYPYGIERFLTAFPKGNDEHRVSLQNITKEVIASFSDHLFFQKTCLEAYPKHKDFNFLPIEVYLFHFLFTNSFDEVLDETGQHILYSRGVVQKLLSRVLKFLWRKVGMFSVTSLWRFLLELHDGRGRTPLHVAVDEGMVWRFRRTIRKVEFFREAFDIAMTASDSSGRTPLHRAIIHGGSTDTALVLRSMLASDVDAWTNLNAACNHTIVEMVQSRSYHTFSLNSLSRTKGFPGRDFLTNAYYQKVFTPHSWYEGEDVYHLLRSTPLQSAVIHRRTEILKSVLDEVKDKDSALLTEPPPLLRRVRFGDWQFFANLETLELAAIVGDASIVKVLLESGIQVLQRQSDKSTRENFSFVDCRNGLWQYGNQLLQRHSHESTRKRSSSEKTRGKAWPEESPSRDTWRNDWPLSGLHLAAALGNIEVLNLFLEHGTYNAFEEDWEGNNALHHAMNRWDVVLENNFLDYVHCKQFISSQENENQFSPPIHDSQWLTSEDFFLERQGCINLFLQAGCDMFKPNKENQVPNPGPDLRRNAKFLSWWYKKKANEFATVQNTLNVAANAVAVTATLVATASYVGPLQPPLGYSGSPDQLQVGNIWVRIFIVCDTLSFYFAIAAIIFSLIPSLPMPQESMMQEVRHTFKMVTIAIALLFPSIVCILVAFAASSIAIVSYDVGASIGANLIRTTAAIGGFVSLIAIFMFLSKLLGFVLHRNPSVRNACWKLIQGVYQAMRWRHE